MHCRWFSLPSAPTGVRSPDGWSQFSRSRLRCSNAKILRLTPCGQSSTASGRLVDLIQGISGALLEGRESKKAIVVRDGKLHLQEEAILKTYTDKMCVLTSWLIMLGQGYGCYELTSVRLVWNATVWIPSVLFCRQMSATNTLSTNIQRWRCLWMESSFRRSTGAASCSYTPLYGTVVAQMK